MNPFLDGQDDDEYQRRLREQTVAQLRPEDVEPLYQQHLGRASDPEGMANHLKNPYGMAGVESAIKGSQEFAQRQQTPEVTKPTPQAEIGATGTTGAGGTATGWGFDSPTGGRKEFSYTPKSYGDDFSRFEGFRDQAALDADPNAQASIKYIFRNAAAGVPLDGNFVTTVVARLREQGINATPVGTDQIDFGNGEGPIDVVRGGTESTGYHGVQWIPGGSSGGGTPPASPAGPVSGGGAGSSAAGTGDSLSQIQALIQELLKSGYSRDALLSQMQG